MLRRFGRKDWTLVAVLWLAASIVWTPGSYLSSNGAAGFESFAAAFVQMAFHFAPWALATPLFAGLSWRFPIGLSGVGKSIAVFALLAILIVPLFTAIGIATGRVFLSALQIVSLRDAFGNFGLAVSTTSFFALPTYVALVAIGQTLAYLERFRERERLLTAVRSEALRAQIAPHFLFNALSAISELGYRDPARADEGIVRLSRLLRETIDRPDWTNLRDEMRLIEDFVALHRILMDDRLRTDFAVGAGCDEAKLPSLLLQPLIENALVHGVSRLARGGVLRLRTAVRGDRLTITIENDAPAITDNAALGFGTGLGNVRQRLHAAFGARASLSFERSERAATVSIELPFRMAIPA